MEKKLKRSKNQFVGGVCAGLAEYLHWDPTLVRVLYAAFTFFSFGTGIILYIICWMVMPVSEE
jgi:phage shock protein C